MKFLSSLLTVYNEHKQKDYQELEKRIENYSLITKEIFNEVLYDLDPKLPESSINKLFIECSFEGSKVLSESLIKLILKYGIGGYGVGPFKFKQLSSILSFFIEKSKTLSVLQHSSDLIPYKISVNVLDSNEKSFDDNFASQNILEILPSRNTKSSSSRRSSIVSSASPIQRSYNASKFFSNKRINSPAPIHK